MSVAAVLTLASFVPLSFLVLDGPSTSIALWALVVTTVGGIAKQYLADRRVRQMGELQLRRDLALRADLKANTDLTQTAVVQAKQAYSEANNVNGKIAELHGIQQKLLAACPPAEQAAKIADLSDYVHKRVHDLVGHVMTIKARTNPNE